MREYSDIKSRNQEEILFFYLLHDYNWNNSMVAAVFLIVEIKKRNISSLSTNLIYHFENFKVWNI